MKINVCTSAAFFCCMLLTSQNISDHQWTQRVLLILSSNPRSAIVDEQMVILNKNPQGMADRKLIVYKITRNETKFKDFEAKHWSLNTEVYNRYTNGEPGFYVVLIGLDGSVKLQRSALVGIEDLFALIDAMPMRRTELRNKQ